MLILGLCAVLSGQHYLSSNREFEEGMFDIQLKSRDPAMPGVLIKFKAEKNRSSGKVKVLTGTALRQIIDWKYDTELSYEGITTILKYGIALSGKDPEIIAE